MSRAIPSRLAPGLQRGAPFFLLLLLTFEFPSDTVKPTMDEDTWESREFEREIETLNPTPVDPGQPAIEGERHEPKENNNGA